ncbi:hypothetical protein GCM10023201_27090 [Actinomycetospora corticicola]|uniref:Uncharacterized protein n=1 Tax=Actinomycetospora corticicola TaxID=663602 RepID=A0A7Y9DXD7_9PSEU|nr:hypothetical protein [Actinomycetospora corticicola]NYD37156.1 hypothetical protein [Actinomycetospora corticicola]
MITSARRARWILGLSAVLLLLAAGAATATPRPLTVPFIVSVGPATGGPVARVAAAPGDAVVVSSGPGGRLSLRVVPTTRRALRVLDLAPVAIVVQVSRDGRPVANTRLSPGSTLVVPARSAAG